MDFWISKWISGFQSGFLGFKVNFWISKWISGFQSGFLDFKWISWFQSGFLDFIWTAIILKTQLKYTHDSLTGFLSAYMLTEYKVTGISLLHSAQAAYSLIVIHIHKHTWLLYIFIAYCVFVVIHIHTIWTSFIHMHGASYNCNYITSKEWPLYPTEDRPGTKVIHYVTFVHTCSVINESIRIFADYFNRILNWISGF